MFRSFVRQFVSEFQGGNCTHLRLRVSYTHVIEFCYVLIWIFLTQCWRHYVFLIVRKACDQFPLMGIFVISLWFLGGSSEFA